MMQEARGRGFVHRHTVKCDFAVFKLEIVQPYGRPDMPECVYKANLAVRIDNRAQKFPGASSSIHSHHPQNLQETKAPQE